MPIFVENFYVEAGYDILYTGNVNINFIQQLTE